MRLATPLDPILDNLYFETFAFFVPYRTIWDNFEKFHGAQDDPGDSITFTVPVLNSVSSQAVGSLADYFGIPSGVANIIGECSSLPFRAYQKIYNDWFRSATLQDSLTETTGNGPDTMSNYSLVKRGKRFDYFTSCIPAPQRGTAVSLPLGTSAPVTTDATENENMLLYAPNGGGTTNLLDITSTFLTLGATSSEVVSQTWYADLTDATAATVNDVRLAFATQHILERDARSGTRYVEVLKNRWGVTSPDFRLQRAEFLGSGSTMVNITPVQQQSAQSTPAANDKLGNLAAYGTASGQHSWSKSFVEHGVVIVLGNLRGDITYSQGLNRYWEKSTRYDFVYPEMATIGEQAVTTGEIWAESTLANNAVVFGYAGRYDEYRFLNSQLTGLMRVDASGTLANWHLSEDFGSAPTLGDTFIQANTITPLDRAVAIPSEPHMIADFYHTIRAARPLPTFGVPGLTRL